MFLLEGNWEEGRKLPSTCKHMHFPVFALFFPICDPNVWPPRGNCEIMKLRFHVFPCPLPSQETGMKGVFGVVECDCGGMLSPSKHSEKHSPSVCGCCFLEVFGGTRWLQYIILVNFTDRPSDQPSRTMMKVFLWPLIKIIWRSSKGKVYKCKPSDAVRRRMMVCLSETTLWEVKSFVVSQEEIYEPTRNPTLNKLFHA